MNLLLDRAPESIEIDGIEYAIDADYRNCIKFESLMFDPEISDDLRAMLALRLFYPEIPPDVPEALNKIIWFYGCGKESNKSSSVGGNGGKRICSYEYDGGYIYAAFLVDYSIDLEAIDYLHWWKFRALFDSLRPENLICKIMEYRSADIGRLKGEQRKFYQQMKRIYALPVPRDEAEKLDAISDALMNGADVSEVLEQLKR